MAITKQQIKQLKGSAHHLKAIIQAGKEGMTEQFLKGVEDALKSRELIKVKFLEHSELHPGEDGLILAEKLGADLVGTIGSVVILYRYSEKVKTHILDALEQE